MLAQEVGHHVKNLPGRTEKVQAQQGRLPNAEHNHLSVRLELQADLLAGIRSRHAGENWRLPEEGDTFSAAYGKL